MLDLQDVDMQELPGRVAHSALFGSGRLVRALHVSTALLWLPSCSHAWRGARTMLWTICIILLVLWALGVATSYTAGGLIHILLVIAPVVMVIRLIQGRRVLG
jgi:hypothetical protein